MAKAGDKYFTFPNICICKNICVSVNYYMYLIKLAIPLYMCLSLLQMLYNKMPQTGWLGNQF